MAGQEDRERVKERKGGKRERENEKENLYMLTCSHIGKMHVACLTLTIQQTHMESNR